MICKALPGQEHFFEKKMYSLTNELVTSQQKDLTSQHNDLTRRHRDLKSQHNYLTSNGKIMPPLKYGNKPKTTKPSFLWGQPETMPSNI